MISRMSNRFLWYRGGQQQQHIAHIAGRFII